MRGCCGESPPAGLHNPFLGRFCILEHRIWPRDQGSWWGEETNLTRNLKALMILTRNYFRRRGARRWRRRALGEGSRARATSHTTQHNRNQKPESQFNDTSSDTTYRRHLTCTNQKYKGTFFNIVQLRTRDEILNKRRTGQRPCITYVLRPLSFTPRGSWDK